MPLYSFSTKTGTIVNRFFPMSSVPNRVKTDDGEWAYRDYRAEQTGRPHTEKLWPRWSGDFLSVTPEEVPEMRQALKEAGVPTEVSPAGRLKLTSRSHRARVLRALGLYDRSAGYSDPTPGESRKFYER